MQNCLYVIRKYIWQLIQIDNTCIYQNAYIMQSHTKLTRFNAPSELTLRGEGYEVL